LPTRALGASIARVNRLADVRTRIAELVAEPSSSSADARFDLGNREVVEKLASWCDSLGMRTELTQVGRDEKANLAATLGEGPGGLVLAGHSDTVPWDEGKWSRDPFACTKRAAASTGSAPRTSNRLGAALLRQRETIEISIT